MCASVIMYQKFINAIASKAVSEMLPNL